MAAAAAAAAAPPAEGRDGRTTPDECTPNECDILEASVGPTPSRSEGTLSANLVCVVCVYLGVCLCYVVVVVLSRKLTVGLRSCTLSLFR